MAKKKTETKEVVTSETEVARLDVMDSKLADNIGEIHKRIDRIVAAIDKSKPVKGL